LWDRLRRAAGSESAVPALSRGVLQWLRRAAAHPGIQALGTAYAAAGLEESDAVHLAGALEPPDVLTAGETAVWLRERTTADFAAGRTVLLRGWVLARSEVRMAALAVQLSPSVEADRDADLPLSPNAAPDPLHQDPD
jgi:hypothetical protein